VIDPKRGFAVATPDGATHAVRQDWAPPTERKEGSRRDYLYPVPPETIRPYGNLLFVRHEWNRWTKSASGIVHPTLRTGHRRDFGGVVSKNDTQTVTVLAIGPKVRAVKVGDRVVVVTHAAVGNYLFNYVPAPKYGEGIGRYDFFVHETRLRFENSRDADGFRGEVRREGGLVGIVED